MSSANDYSMSLTAGPGPAVAHWAYVRVWRFDFAAPGFFVLDARGEDSRILRGRIVGLADRLGRPGSATPARVSGFGPWPGSTSR